LFLLLQPLEEHLWSEGAIEVTEQCATWRCLKEAVGICSLNLITDISVLNLQPFLSARGYHVLTEIQRHELDELVFDAIRSMKPHDLLGLFIGEVRTV
jgi:hypothetical protein